MRRYYESLFVCGSSALEWLGGEYISSCPDVPVLEEAPRLDPGEFQQFVAGVAREQEQGQEQGQGQGMGEIVCECMVQEPRPPDPSNWAEEFADFTSSDAALHQETAEGKEAYR